MINAEDYGVCMQPSGGRRKKEEKMSWEVKVKLRPGPLAELLFMGGTAVSMQWIGNIMDGQYSVCGHRYGCRLQTVRFILEQREAVSEYE